MSEQAVKPPILVEHFAVQPLGCNCVILGDLHSKKAIVVDPGGELDKILLRLAKHGLKCEAIVHTHTHFDHCSVSEELQKKSGAPVMMHEGDLFLYQGLQMQLNAFGIPLEAPPSGEVDRFLKHGDVVQTGDAAASVIHTPGHTPGSLCFEVAGSDRPILLSGDTLFQHGIGRTDLWGGDPQQIVQSIGKKLYALPEETLVIPGHGPATTIGQEKHSNPFVRA